MDYVENRTFDEIKIGDAASLVRTLSKDDISLFAVMSGDVNPTHVDDEYAKSDTFHKIIAHGMWGGALISTLLGTKLPGPGTITSARGCDSFAPSRSATRSPCRSRPRPRTENRIA
jgi:acyl dehydratase